MQKLLNTLNKFKPASIKVARYRNFKTASSFFPWHCCLDVMLTVALACFAFFPAPRVFEKRRDCSQSKKCPKNNIVAVSLLKLGYPLITSVCNAIIQKYYTTIYIFCLIWSRGSSEVKATVSYFVKLIWDSEGSWFESDLQYLNTYFVT